MQKSSLKHNFIMNIILTMSSFIFPLITFPYISHILLPEGTGKIAFVTSVVSYFAMIAQLGIPTYGIRACARVRDDREELTRTVHELLWINLVMSVFSYLLLEIAIVTVPRLKEDRALFLIIGMTILLNAIGVEWLYKGLEEYTYITVRSLIFKVISVVAMFSLVHAKSDYLVYAGISIFASSASNILNFINAHKYIRMGPVGNYHPLRHMKAVAVFFAMACATTIYTNLDTVMLGFMTTDTDVGYYNAAVKIKGILVSIVTSLGTVLMPRASYYVEHDKIDEFLKITKKALHFVVLLALPLTFYFILYAREGVYFLSGKAYEGAVIPMQIIMPTLLLIGLTNIMGIQMLVPLGKEKLVLYSEIAGAIVDLGLNGILIPRLGASGAAIGTLVAELVVWIVQFAELQDLVFPMYQAIPYWKIITAGVIASVAAGSIKLLSLSNFITLLISAIVFFGVYLGGLTMVKESLVRELEEQFLCWIRKYINATDQK